MFNGQLIGIFVAERKGHDLHPLDSAEAVAGRGLVGDRYFLKKGTFSDKDGPDREVTLIEVEALEGMAREYELKLEPAQARRNLLTRGVPLNHLVGQTFAVGPVVLRGLRLCEPCGHLERLTCKGVQKGLVHRGGLRAQVISGGLLTVGAAIAEQGQALEDVEDLWRNSRIHSHGEQLSRDQLHEPR
jgi:MOSC domain-containing protein YiiM